MATTLSTDLYTPEVWANIAQKEFVGKAIIGSSPAVLTDTNLEGQPGDEVVFPSWMLMSDMADVAETAALVPEKITQSSFRATIKEAGKAAEWTDRAKLTGIGNIQDETLRQFGILAARKTDADLTAAAIATVAGGITYADGSTATASAPKAITLTGGLTWANIVKAILSFGDDFDPADFAGVFVNPTATEIMLNDQKFIDAFQGPGANSLLNNGLIGQRGGFSFYTTSRLGATQVLFLKKNSLGLFMKRRPLVEQGRDILGRKTVVATTMHYGVKRIKDDGVLVGTIA